MSYSVGVSVCTCIAWPSPSALLQVSYLTVMDVYLNGSFGFMLVCTLSCFIFAVWARVDTSSRPRDQDTIDLVAFSTLVGTFALFHVYFAWRCRRAIAAGDEKLLYETADGKLEPRERASLKEEELHQKLKKQEQQRQASMRNLPVVGVTEVVPA